MRTPAHIPRWLRLVMVCDRAGSAWFIGAGFFFAPILVLVSPWPVLTTVAWVLIGAAAVWLGLLGVVMATGLALVLRSNGEVGEDFWRSIIDYPTTPSHRAAPDSRCRCSRPASV
ncbi:hypothetical protein CRI77_23220 [Mycolicibacterium duvalii]|uniref:hypothetical protein n=1 Tax=Mycolicibacterium duvalii TaxID=39688 RepID=UPI000BEEA4EA|nr:hypothetical protein [Mycolicibacterium duvalii]PEG36438.1 hypothetical protein CRI77_23220 [Mycolicibacterium duvalii]